MDHFTKKAQAAEKSFFKKLAARTFTTGNGRTNTIERVTETAVYITTEKGTAAHRISREKLRKAVRFLLFKRSATRKQLEKCSAFSSAVFGLLRSILVGSAKVKRTRSGFLRLIVKGVRFFFSGASRAVRDLEVAAANGAQFVLFSFFDIRGRTAWKQHVERLGLKILLDSGAFSLWNAAKKGKTVEPITVEAYADFIEANRSSLVGWFNLDVIGDAEGSAANAAYLKARGLAPVEVWHAGSDLAELARICATNPELVALGGTVGMKEEQKAAIFAEVFEQFPAQPFHFLGGASALLNAFEWASSDATTWLNGRKYNQVITAAGTYRDHGRDGLEIMAENVRYLASLEAVA